MGYPYRDHEASARFRVDELEAEVKRLEAEVEQAREREHQLVVYAATAEQGGVAPVLVIRERRKNLLRRATVAGFGFGIAMTFMAFGFPFAAMWTIFCTGRMVER